MPFRDYPASRRTATEIINLVTPVITMLMPTSVPVAHIELAGQCCHLMSLRISVTIPSNSVQPDPLTFRSLKYAAISITPSVRKKNPTAKRQGGNP